MKKIRLLRYEDPDGGPRKMPVFDQPELGKVAVSSAGVFHVNLSDSTVSLQENGSNLKLGSQLMYIVD